MEEKQYIPVGEPLTTVESGADASRPHSTKSLHRYQSYGDGHGHVCVPHDNDDDDQESGELPDGTVECKWDGDNDPMNPRSMSRGRKWLIVLIVSGTSLCVLV